MKPVIKLFILMAVAAIFFAGCDKTRDLPYYQNGIKPVLNASATNIAPAPADSDKVALTLTWTYPNHATNDPNSIKYIIEIDSTGKNFIKAYSKTIIGALNTAFTGKDLNNILLSNGYAFNVPVDMDIRVTSSYGNNNERLTSDIVTVKMTPYKVPPKVPLPASGKLFIVGSATQGGWNNPVPAPAQELARISETTFAGIFQLSGGQEYLLLPENGDWTHKYGVADKSVAGLNEGGNFGYDLGENIPAPATSGFYKIVVDFQAGKFAVTPYTGVLPDSLFIIGDATAGGWNNPVPVPSQQLTRINSSVFEITLSLTGGKQYLFIPENGSWDHKYGVEDDSVTGLSEGGDFGYDLSDNIPAPATSGTYKVEVNFVTGKFSVTK